MTLTARRRRRNRMTLIVGCDGRLGMKALIAKVYLRSQIKIYFVPMNIMFISFWWGLEVA